MVHGSGSSGHDRAAQDHGCRAPDFPRTRALRKTGRKPRSYQWRPPFAERRVVVVGESRLDGTACPSTGTTTGYARTEEWLAIVNGMWTEEEFSYSSDYFQVDGAILEPKPIQKPRPTVYAGGESPAGKELISRTCDA